MRHDEQDEYLELLYHLRERHQTDVSTLASHNPNFKREILDELEQKNFITFDGDQINVTDDGFNRAEQIVRRHRLAERLLTDVLHMSPAEVEKSACEFEHIVAEEITESICILLGHPRRCPHGSPIPEGKCCRTAASECVSVVKRVTEVPVGTWVRIAYINSGSDERQHRLTHLGIMPGSLVKLHQLQPSIVLMLENNTVAMERAIARDIYVWNKCHDHPTPKNYS
jgi:DtxR family Mn-dependent transcriptional regulator